MYSTQQLIAGITNEFNILKHLGTKVTDANHAHKFSDPQRNTQELGTMNLWVGIDKPK